MQIDRTAMRRARLSLKRPAEIIQLRDNRGRNRIITETPRTGADTYLYMHSLLAAMEIPR